MLDKEDAGWSKIPDHPVAPIRPDGPDFDRFIIDPATATIKFRRNDGLGYVSFAAGELSRVEPLLSLRQAKAIKREMEKIMSAIPHTSPVVRTGPGKAGEYAPTIHVGDEFKPFGKLKRVTRHTKEAVFENEGDSVLLSAEMIAKLGEALTAAGAITAAAFEQLTAAVSETADPWGGADPSLGYEDDNDDPVAETVEFITKDIRGASDRRAAAALWLTKLTNEITQIIREEDEK